MMDANVSERLKEAVSKTVVGQPTAGSNPVVGVKSPEDIIESRYLPGIFCNRKILRGLWGA